MTLWTRNGATASFLPCWDSTSSSWQRASMPWSLPGTMPRTSSRKRGSSYGKSLKRSVLEATFSPGHAPLPAMWCAPISDRARRKPLVLSSEVQDLVMARFVAVPEQPDRRLEMLADCVKRLSEEAVVLFALLHRQTEDQGGAVEMGRSLTGTYSALSRIRRNCSIACRIARTGKRNDERQAQGEHRSLASR